VPNSVGVHAVEMFFLISGFVIFMTLDRCKSVVDFVVLRFSRLYPTYWVALLLATGIGVITFGDAFWLGGLVSNATMFQEFLGAPHADVVFWSLSVEMAFYLNAAWLFALGLHRSPKRVVAAWLVVACVWALVFKEPHPEHRQWPALLFALDFAPYFSMGIVFYDAMKFGWSNRRASLLGFAVVAALLIGGWEALLVATLIAGIFGLAVSGRLSFLVSPVTLWLGGISYALYVIHRKLGYQTLAWMNAHHIEAWLAIPITILGALALATLINYAIERPALSAIRLAYYGRAPRETRAA
jgi:peptidoglycan/LPS O-acetylase OafA/YrhL